MKAILLLFVAVFFLKAADAQISNTRWKTTIKINEPLNVIFDFKNDSVSLYKVADSSIIETMTYTDDGNAITFKKIDGQSDCDNETPGKYSYKINNDSLFLYLLQDGCDDRWTVIDSSKWTRWRDRTEVKVDGSILKQYAGVYQMDASHPITISYENGSLYAEGPNNKLPKSPLMAESTTKFFLKVAGVEWDFVKDANGKVTKLISHEEKDYELKKVK